MEFLIRHRFISSLIFYVSFTPSRSERVKRQFVEFLNPIDPRGNFGQNSGRRTFILPQSQHAAQLSHRDTLLQQKDNLMRRKPKRGQGRTAFTSGNFGQFWLSRHRFTSIAIRL
jgi:hypothetical protein